MHRMILIVAMTVAVAGLTAGAAQAGDVGMETVTGPLGLQTGRHANCGVVNASDSWKSVEIMLFDITGAPRGMKDADLAPWGADVLRVQITGNPAEKRRIYCKGVETKGCPEEEPSTSLTSDKPKPPPPPPMSSLVVDLYTEDFFGQATASTPGRLIVDRAMQKRKEVCEGF